MTRFNRFDHDDAMRAANDAKAAGVTVAQADMLILSRVAGAFACNMPESFPRERFSAALERVRAATEAAKAGSSNG